MSYKNTIVQISNSEKTHSKVRVDHKKEFFRTTKFYTVAGCGARYFIPEKQDVIIQQCGMSSCTICVDRGGIVSASVISA